VNKEAQLKKKPAIAQNLLLQEIFLRKLDNAT
jgi:hypothetical protein